MQVMSQNGLRGLEDGWMNVVAIRGLEAARERHPSRAVGGLQP